MGPEGHSNPSMGTQCGTPLPGLGMAPAAAQMSGEKDEEEEEEEEEEEDEKSEEEEDAEGKQNRKRRASVPNQRLRKAADSARTPGMIGELCAAVCSRDVLPQRPPCAIVDGSCMC